MHAHARRICILAALDAMMGPSTLASAGKTLARRSFLLEARTTQCTWVRVKVKTGPGQVIMPVIITCQGHRLGDHKKLEFMDLLYLELRVTFAGHYGSYQTILTYGTCLRLVYF